MESAPTRLLPFLLRYRYVALALAFNLPGNAVLGGGGGIAMMAGLSGIIWRIAPSPKNSSPTFSAGKIIGTAADAIRWSIRMLAGRPSRRARFQASWEG